MKHFPLYWPFVRGIHRSPVDSPHKGQWHGVLMFSLFYVWTSGGTNYRDAGHLRRHHAHYEVTVVFYLYISGFFSLLYVSYDCHNTCELTLKDIGILHGCVGVKRHNPKNNATYYVHYDFACWVFVKGSKMCQNTFLWHVQWLYVENKSWCFYSNFVECYSY